LDLRRAGGSEGLKPEAASRRMARQGSAWAEGWDLMICGKLHRLRIQLTPAAGGGVDFGVTE